MASSLDQVWVFAKTVEDARLLLWLISWFDPQDSQSDKKADDKNFLQSSDLQEIKNYKIAVPKQVFSEWLDPRIKERFQIMIEKLKSEWYFLSEVDLPVLSYSLPIYYTLVPAEISTNMARFDGIKFWLQGETGKFDDIFKYYERMRSEWFWDEVKRRILLWTFVLSSANYEWYYLRAQKARQKLKADFNKVFSEYDLILLPTTPDIPWKIWEKVDDPVKMYLSDLFTVPANLAWIPAMSIPMWMVSDWDEELPTWIQIMANRRNENKILDLAEVI
jgi:aspartyl-tRNA(Asn)/glutamyl-tRNA(Gln) amidotransferase subunit A